MEKVMPYITRYLFPVVAVVVVLFIGVMGSIYGGIATPTESAAIGCVLTLIIAAGYGLLTRDVLGRALAGSVKTTAMVLCIYWAAKLMGVFLTYEQITSQLSSMVLELGLSPHANLAALIVFYLVLGMLMDGLAAMVMTLPNGCLSTAPKVCTCSRYTLRRPVSSSSTL